MQREQVAGLMLSDDCYDRRGQNKGPRLDCHKLSLFWIRRVAESPRVLPHIRYSNYIGGAHCYCVHMLGGLSLAGTDAGDKRLVVGGS